MVVLDAPVPLTARQKDVLGLIAHGLTNAQIGEALTLTPGTVANYIEALLKRTEASNRVQLAAWAVMQQQKEQLAALLRVLERFQALQPGDLRDVLSAAVQIIGEGFQADAADAFLYEPACKELVAVGGSQTAMGQQQRRLGLHRLSLEHGGRISQVFLSGQPYRSGYVEQDAAELLAVRQVLGVRSTLAVPLLLDGTVLGVLAVNSARAEAFTPEQLQLLVFAGQWLSLLVRVSPLLALEPEQALA